MYQHLQKMMSQVHLEKVIFSSSYFLLLCITEMEESRSVTAPPRPVRPAGRCRKLTGRGGDGALENLTVFPPVDNNEFLKYVQILRDIF